MRRRRTVTDESVDHWKFKFKLSWQYRTSCCLSCLSPLSLGPAAGLELSLVIDARRRGGHLAGRTRPAQPH